MSMDKPTICRSLEYSLRQGNWLTIIYSFRLGLPGFLTSAELRSAGYKPNNHLRDQRVAFEWLRKHVADFGGNGEEITVAGESAGAGSKLPIRLAKALKGKKLMRRDSGRWTASAVIRAFVLPGCNDGRITPYTPRLRRRLPRGGV